MRHEYSLAVALFDFLPVAATALGMAWLAQAAARRHRALSVAARIAAVLVPLGGACKATWKLGISTGRESPAWLGDLLFVLMAPGFAMMAFCLFHAMRAWRGGVPPTIAAFSPARLLAWTALPLALSALCALAWPESRAWFFCLLAATSLASATLLIHAIRAARLGGLGAPVTALFMYSLAALLAMGGLARLPPGETAAWIQESVNLSAQAAFAAGCWHLNRRMRRGDPA